jgi:hypothetical protein
VSRGSDLCVVANAFAMESRNLPGFKPLVQHFREAGQDLGRIQSESALLPRHFISLVVLVVSSGPVNPQCPEIVALQLPLHGLTLCS